MRTLDMVQIYGIYDMTIHTREQENITHGTEIQNTVIDNIHEKSTYGSNISYMRTLYGTNICNTVIDYCTYT